MDSASINKVRKVAINSSSAGQRIDNFLMRELGGLPKSKIYNIIRKGEVRVNGGRIKPMYKLKDGDEVRIPPVRISQDKAKPVAGDGVKELIGNSIIFEDEAFIVIDKPSGLAVHGGSGINIGLIEVLRQMRQDERFLELVHRIDRDTSGCILIAKKRSRLREIHELLRTNKVDKRYCLLVRGSWQQGLAVIDKPLKKFNLKSGERMVRVSEDGKKSVTRIKILQRYNQATLLEAKLETGRTHQIRVHVASCGKAIFGDEKYSSKDDLELNKKIGGKRLFLHSASLEFTLPSSGKKYTIVSQLPDDLKAVLNNLQETGELNA